MANFRLFQATLSGQYVKEFGVDFRIAFIAMGRFDLGE